MFFIVEELTIVDHYIAFVIAVKGLVRCFAGINDGEPRMAKGAMRIGKVSLVIGATVMHCLNRIFNPLLKAISLARMRKYACYAAHKE